MKDKTYYFHQTPPELCKKLIEFVPFEPNDKVLEPFKGEGGFYNNLPNTIIKNYCEIEEGKDYKDYNDNIDWVVSNPPFCFEYNSDVKRRPNAFYSILLYFSSRVNKGIAYLVNDICLSSLTPKRIKELNNNGLYIHNIVVCSVKKWRGRYFFIIFRKQKSDVYKYIEGSF